ncbi:aminodeoxychorismate synthase component I [Parabacteroides sp. 52]|uniref:aminodeoxychorismate synthase component I n=1 Tax=unclassified Parabacteroides TaxID=2649774 RepID=UPI0013D29494|nr:MULTISPECIES: aminodeoxychorismate synthase component I [unclassified Parabacteroides]MDH6535320.1 para-aminobenzoate synthetase component 1 [Parabacteroides sp. PM5-20]NDV55888.1 aminodeoxychorismate synthase component I [Parabacteroides sp. 52]
MKAQEIQTLMNAYGKSQIPFLFAVTFEKDKGIFIEQPMEQADILFRTPQVNNIKETITKPTSHFPEITSNPISFEDYKQRFDRVTEGLMRGDSYLTNLTVRTPITLNIGLRDIFLLSQSPYGLYIPNQFVCFSPERFVKIANGTISTNPMKGTISANLPNAEQVILSDEKETAEHCTIVDLLRNDIGMVAEGVKVERFRYIDRISTQNSDILQVSSEISGKLSGDYLSHLGDIVFRMLPAGSVSGAPKQSTLTIINKAESESRGYYTGIFGYFDGKELDTAVLIRFIEQSEEKFYFHSGGGITVNSVAESEYSEVLAKIYLPFL